MRSTAARVILGIVLLAAAVVLLIVLKDDSGGGGEGRSSGPDATHPKANGKKAAAIPTIVVKDGAPVGGVADLSFEAGQRIRFRVRSDASEEIHVHGYDIAKEVDAGGTVAFDFPAEIEGVFEVELEGVGEQVAELEVAP